jgi:hypothetical protein
VGCGRTILLCEAADKADLDDLTAKASPRHSRDGTDGGRGVLAPKELASPEVEG